MAAPSEPAGFIDDPIAPHSAQFPLGRAGDVVPPADAASQPGRRPWGLGGMRPVRHKGDPVRASYHYDHDAQVAVNSRGLPLLAADPTVDKVSSFDGDEGPSEDFRYDFCPDSPYPA